MQYNNYYIFLKLINTNTISSLIIRKVFNSLCMLNMTPDETLHMQVFKKQNKGTLIQNQQH